LLAALIHAELSNKQCLDGFDAEIKNTLGNLPSEPGIYRFSDIKGNIIYVGKAKNIKKRVASYFTKHQGQSGKLRVMVSKIKEINYLVTESESDALLLENNLIKQYQPRYNILLKDDKTFPWVRIPEEPFPRIMVTRDYKNDGALYFGPYTSVKLMRSLLDLIRQLYTYRTCSLNLSKKNIKANKYKVCLEHHIGNCKGPCQCFQSEEEYGKTIEEVVLILKGNLPSLNRKLRTMMHEFAASYEFEKAQLVKEKLEILERHQARSPIVNPAFHNIDVFSIIGNEDSAYVNYIKVIEGAVVQSHSMEIRKKLDEDISDILASCIVEMRQRFHSQSKEIIVPFVPEFLLNGVKFLAPQKGDKKTLLEMSERNLKYFVEDIERRKSLIDPERHSKRLLESLKKDLRLPELPMRIECIDNSHFQGSHTVSAVIVFEKAKPLPKDYRHYNLDSLKVPDDYAGMTAVIERRYARLLKEGGVLPQLLIIDGGKGQLNAALKVLDSLSLRGKISIISIAKKLEEIYFPNDPYPMHLPKTSESLRLIQKIRNEAHRFCIGHHRKKRSKAALESELEKIKGIGKKTSTVLLSHFKSPKRVFEANFDELSSLIGKTKAEIIKNYKTEQTP